MSQTWQSGEMPVLKRPTGLQWVLVIAKALAIIVVFVLGVLFLLPLRVIEKPVYQLRRPWTSTIKQMAFRLTLVVLGLRVRRHGVPMQTPGAIVANHSSWLDIIVLNAGQRVAFVSKAEVARWPVIGWLARVTGTVFIRRDRKEAASQQLVLSEALNAGRRLLFFPEGTSTDGMRVLPFKSTLFGIFYSNQDLAGMRVQPVSVVYAAPAREDARFYGWWGDMDLAPHLLQVLASWRQGHVTVTHHDPVAVRAFLDRKALARALEKSVRDGLPDAPERRA